MVQANLQLVLISKIAAPHPPASAERLLEARAGESLKKLQEPVSISPLPPALLRWASFSCFSLLQILFPAESHPSLGDRNMITSGNGAPGKPSPRFCVYSWGFWPRSLLHFTMFMTLLYSCFVSFGTVPGLWDQRFHLAFLCLFGH